MRNLKIRLSTALSMLLMMALFTSCENDRSVNLAENEEQREEVYQQILNDQELFNEFMAEMRENRGSMDMMRQNRPMMRNMYGRQQMQNMMKNNPEMMDSMRMNMMTMIEQDTTMELTEAKRQRMVQHMTRMMERDSALHARVKERMQDMESN